MHPGILSLLDFFEYEHLLQAQQKISKPFHVLAHEMVGELQDSDYGAELTTGLRKLLEAKDCMVRASLSKS